MPTYHQHCRGERGDHHQTLECFHFVLSIPWGRDSPNDTGERLTSPSPVSTVVLLLSYCLMVVRADGALVPLSTPAVKALTVNGFCAHGVA